MLDNVVDALSLALSVEDVAARLTWGLLCGLLVAFFYKHSYRTVYVSAFVASLVLLTVTTACVIMVIGDSLARAFGLAGAMSIIRFRTALKDTHDILFVFIALTVGLAIGVGLYLVAVVSTIFIGSVAWTLRIFSGHADGVEIEVPSLLRQKKDKKQVDAKPVNARLEFAYTLLPDGDGTALGYRSALEAHCKEARLAEVRGRNKDRPGYDLAFRILLDPEQAEALVKTLLEMPGIEEPTLSFKKEPTDTPEDD